MTVDAIGWGATAVFVASYFVRQTNTLRRIQGAAACLWIIYGIAVGAPPVIGANVIVAAAALASSFDLSWNRPRRSRTVRQDPDA
jgi:hypothetical protein